MGAKMANELKTSLYKGDEQKVLSTDEFAGFVGSELRKVRRTFGRLVLIPPKLERHQRRRRRPDSAMGQPIRPV